MPSTPSETPPLDERALEEAARAAYEQFVEDHEEDAWFLVEWSKLADKELWRERARAAVTAYLGAIAALEQGKE